MDSGGGGPFVETGSSFGGALTGAGCDILHAWEPHMRGNR
jgi:hypothetical protein